MIEASVHEAFEFDAAIAQIQIGAWPPDFPGDWDSAAPCLSDNWFCDYETPGSYTTIPHASIDGDKSVFYPHDFDGCKDACDALDGCTGFQHRDGCTSGNCCRTVSSSGMCISALLLH